MFNRKKIWTVFSICCLYCTASSGIPGGFVESYIKTPAGSSVQALIFVGNDYTAEELQYINNYWKIYHPKAILISNPTFTYNCHNYAWNMSTGGEKRWINFPAIYTTDGSYRDLGYWGAKPPGGVSATWASGKIMFWPEDNEHSAVTTSTQDVLISKWGPCGLYQHAVNDCPYTLNQFHKLYTLKNPITPSTTTNKTYPTGTTTETYPGAVILSQYTVVPANATVVINARTSAIIQSMTVARGGKLNVKVTP